jgi:hypothetical protein
MFWYLVVCDSHKSKYETQELKTNFRVQTRKLQCKIVDVRGFLGIGNWRLVTGDWCWWRFGGGRFLAASVVALRIFILSPRGQQKGRAKMAFTCDH